VSTVSELFPAGGGDNTIDMVASGTLPNGSPVILKADGTVEVVAESSVSESIPAGSEVVFHATDTDYTSISFDPNNTNKFVIAYRTDGAGGGYATAIVGTVSGTSISFGAEYTFNAATSYYTSVTFDPNVADKIIMLYRDGGSSNIGKVLIGTISGTSISFGTPTSFGTSYVYYLTLTVDPNTAGKFVVTYRDYANSNYGTAIVGTITGTSISLGSPVVFNSADSHYTYGAYDVSTPGKLLVVYANYGSTNDGTAVVGTVSGTSISFGAASTFDSGSTGEQTVTSYPSTAGKFIISYRDEANSDAGTLMIATVSGTSVSFGSKYVYQASGGLSDISSKFTPNDVNKVLVAYRDHGTSYYGITTLATISGNSISFATRNVFTSGKVQDLNFAFASGSSGKFVLVYKDDPNSQAGTAVVGQLAVTSTNLTSTNLLGINKKAAVDGATVAIETLGGYVDNQSGLTIGSDYYVATDGSLTTTSTDNVRLGRAVTATSINIRNYV